MTTTMCATTYLLSVGFALLAVFITARQRQDFPTTWTRRATVVALVLVPVLNVVYGAVILQFCQNSSCPINVPRKPPL